MVRVPPKVVSVLCVLQALAIVIGYALTRSTFKIYAQLDASWASEYLPRLAWFTKLMLVAGPWLLILPLAWGTIATLTADLAGGIAEVSVLQTRIGYVLSGSIALFSIMCVVQVLYATWGPPAM